MEDPPCTSSAASDSSGRPNSKDELPISPYTGEFGQYLSEQYSVLKLVLSYLNYFDLNTLREVNTSFQKAADILLKKRSWIQFATLNYMPGTDYRPDPLHSGHFIDLRIEPKVLFTFESMSGGPSSRSRPKICMRLRDRNDNRFFPRSDIVPTSVMTFVSIASKGIIYPDTNNKNKMVIVQSMLNKNLALLYLPLNFNYDVSVFTRVVVSETLLPNPIREFFNKDSRPIRGLIFLKVGTQYIDEIIRFIVQVVSENQSEPFAISGGHVSSLDNTNPPKKNIPGILKAIIFRGDGVRCVSDYISATKVEEAVADLKSTSMFVNSTLGELNVLKTFILMFQCVDRHAIPIDDHTLISNAFPNIPIFGLQTWGEIGYRSIKSQLLTYEPKKRRVAIMHSVKTTYMIISLN